MNTQEFEKNYWRYYLMLETKFAQTLQYVTLSSDNFDTYSNEYAHLIQTVGAELDAFFKVYCGFAPLEYKNISDYAAVILQDWSDIKKQIVKADDISLQPFENWDERCAKQSLFWWEVFDTIKHSRVVNEKVASLKNTIYILAALYMLEMKFFKKLADMNGDVDILQDGSNVFLLDNWTTRYLSSKGAVLQIRNN